VSIPSIPLRNIAQRRIRKAGAGNRSIEQPLSAPAEVFIAMRITARVDN
jgi:hypothetical protein